MDPILSIDRFEIFANGLDHPECLAFDPEGHCWAGGEAGQVYRITPDGKCEEVANLGSFNAGLAFSPSGDLFVCNPAQGVIRVDPRTGRHEVFASHACGEKLLCANFPLFDDAGNLYLSDSGQWMKRNGRVVRFAPDGAEHNVVKPLGYANGLALDAPNERLFVVESDTNRVLSYDLDTLGLPEPVAENVGRMPDGVVRDDAGNLYVACYASDEIWRISAAGEKQLFAHDPWAIKLSRPTNLLFRDGYIYVANLGRYTITRAKL
jgi:gluconolactonase